jgi:hypothetical protein
MLLGAAAAFSLGTRNKSLDAVLLGRWQRPDGGYVIEIKHIEADGRIEAAYFNPDPIHVAEATATREGKTMTIYLKLQDTNYPGSNYHLAYDQQSDQLQGTYYQAVEKMYYDIFFERVK